MDFVDNVNLLETGGYVAKESVKDVAIGDNLSLLPITGIYLFFQLVSGRNSTNPAI